MTLNRQWCMGLFQQILEGLDATPEGSGTALDNTLMLYTSEFSSGAEHSCNDLPILLAGSCGGYFKTGNQVEYNIADTSQNKLAYQSKTGTQHLYTTILNAFGFPDTSFGELDNGVHGPLSSFGISDHPLSEIIA